MSDNTRFDRLDDKLDDVKKEIAELKTVVGTGFAIYNKQLEIHIEATDQNRNDIRFLRQEIAPIKENEKFKKNLWKLAGKILAAAATIATIVFAVLEYLAK